MGDSEMRRSILDLGSEDFYPLYLLIDEERIDLSDEERDDRVQLAKSCLSEMISERLVQVHLGSLSEANPDPLNEERALKAVADSANWAPLSHRPVQHWFATTELGDLAYFGPGSSDDS